MADGPQSGRRQPSHHGLWVRWPRPCSDHHDRRLRHGGRNGDDHHLARNALGNVVRTQDPCGISAYNCYDLAGLLKRTVAEATWRSSPTIPPPSRVTSKRTTSAMRMARSGNRGNNSPRRWAGPRLAPIRARPISNTTIWATSSSRTRTTATPAGQDHVYLQRLWRPEVGHRAPRAQRHDFCR